jgi:hypothetical protein
MNTTLAQPFSNHPDKGTRITPVFHALDPIERTNAQINVLRGVLNSADAFFNNRQQFGEGSNAPDEVIAAAAKTACLAFSQIDNIVDDMSRWSAQDSKHTAALDALLSAETDRAKREASKASTEERMIRLTMSPFMQQRGLLLQRNDGMFIAVNNEQTFMAVGASPQEAIDRFNTEFSLPQELKKEPKKKRASPRKKPKDGPETA